MDSATDAWGPEQCRFCQVTAQCLDAQHVHCIALIGAGCMTDLLSTACGQFGNYDLQPTSLPCLECLAAIASQALPIQKRRVPPIRACLARLWLATFGIHQLTAHCLQRSVLLMCACFVAEQVGKAQATVLAEVLPTMAAAVLHHDSDLMQLFKLGNYEPGVATFRWFVAQTALCMADIFTAAPHNSKPGMSHWHHVRIACWHHASCHIGCLILGLSCVHNEDAKACHLSKVTGSKSGGGVNADDGMSCSTHANDFTFYWSAQRLNAIMSRDRAWATV